MKILYLGSGEFGIESLNTLKDSKHNLELIVTQPPRPAGRGRKKRATPVAAWAEENSMDYIEVENVNHPPAFEQIAQYPAELMVVIAFGQIIGKKLIELCSGGSINVHASLLPKYRGAAPINWAVINGETLTGVSIITLSQKMDAGDILAQSETSIDPLETAGEVHDRLARLAAPLLLETIDRIGNGTATYTPQDNSKATLAPKLKKTDGYLDFSDTATAVKDRIRGFWPWPGASAVYQSRHNGKSERVILAKARAAEKTMPENLNPGTFDENLKVACGRGALEILELKPSGGSLMQFQSFVNGRGTRPGDFLSTVEKKNSGAGEETH